MLVTDKRERNVWYSVMQDLTPELRVCGAGGLLRCYYNYENQGAFLEVVTSGEPEGTVSGVLRSCNTNEAKEDF